MTENTKGDECDGVAENILSPREKQCLIGLCIGQRPAEIAEELGVGEKAVEKYIASAKKKLNAKTRDQTIAIALTKKLIDL